MTGCAECAYCVEGLRDEHDDLCVACTKMPSNEPWGCGYMEIDGIDYVKDRMPWCPLKEQEAVRPRVSSVEQRCGNCNKVIEIDGWKSCPWCEKRIDWEGWWKKNGTRNQDT